MKNLVMGFGRKRARKAGASKTRQLDMLEKMKDYCEEEGVCRRYANCMRGLRVFSAANG